MRHLRGFGRAGLAALALTGTLPGPGSAAVLAVPDESPTIAAALAQAAPGDTVLLDGGTYLEHALTLPPAVTLRGRPGSEVVLDAQLAGRHLVVRAGGESRIESIVFRNGVTKDRRRRDGGSVLLDESAVLTVKDCTFEDMLSPHFGGAIAASAGSDLTLQDCTFERCHAEQKVGRHEASRRRLSRASTSNGGAVHVGRRSRFVAHGSRFLACEAKDEGGAIFLDVDTSAEITDCVFRQSTALAGGGIASDGVRMELARCEFADNVTQPTFRSPAKGGALYLARTEATLDACRFTGNGADQGGALSLDQSESVRLKSCRFTRNTAGAGGAVMTSQSGLRVENSTFDANAAEATNGGAFQIAAGQLELERCTLHGSSSAGGGSALWLTTGSGAALQGCIVVNGSPDPVAGADGSVLDLKCCVLYGNEGGDWTGRLAPLAGTDGNRSVDPRFRNAAGGDLELADDSPCRNAGDCDRIGASAPTSRTTGSTR